MPLFQNSVVEKYLNAQNQNTISEKWEVFKSHFHNPEVQENIRNSKEEQYQEGFLRDLFVNVLGYTLNPDKNYNLTTELRNIKDSKKADGGILVDDKVVAVIELKGTNTTDLSKVETQAFGYKNNQAGCSYVITSNFEKLRFYIDNAIEHIEFNLFQLTQKDFNLLYLCLAFANIGKDIPKKIKVESISQEDVITKKLYKDYSVFKRELFQNLTEQNPDIDPLILFKKSQKLLDRFLFLFFAEDRHLLPVNYIRSILSQWQQVKELDIDETLYERFQKHFNYLNTGFKGKDLEVFPYNGGLFKPDEILDQVKVDDDLLYQHTFKLSEYDFASEVDVNILGHIFENSLNEIDEIKAQLEGQEIDKSKTKRKKDGVFYTPKYITKYIVENTIGKLCTEKKAELEIDDEEYSNDKRKQKKTIENLLNKLTDYRAWLLQLTIVDPACGSGAFLNEALNFLITEHQYTDELETKLMGGGLVFPNIENSILENNLFGVDLNEESVEIAKLSLWLRTAQPNRKLNDLNNNIKCGNSLIDDPEVAGDKAFNWEKEFPQVFAKGGFDVVIGNPPYGAKLDKITDEYLRVKYPEIQFKIDTYSVFLLKTFEILTKNGFCSYIIPNSLLDNYFEEKLREKLLNETKILFIIDLDDKIFESAVVHSMIFGFRYSKDKNYSVEIGSSRSLNFDEYKVPVKYFKEQEKFNFSFRNYQYESLLNTINQNSLKFEKIIDLRQSIKTGNDKKYITDAKLAENYKPILSGRDMGKWYYNNPHEFVNYGRFLACPRDKSIFEQPKILIREAGNEITATLDNNNFYIMSSIYVGILINTNYNLKYVLSLLNSNLFQFQLNLLAFDKTKGAFTKARIYHYNNLPIKIFPLSAQQPFIEKADQMLLLNKDLQEISNKFQRTLQREFSLEKLSKKLENWQELSYVDFLKELKKQKVELSLSQKAEWEDYFLAEQKKAQEIQSKIHSTDKEIDAMVYELYGLTEEEIKIVENS